MTWKLLTTPPTKTGRYIVGHKGTSKIITYIVKPKGKKNTYHSNTKFGWVEDPRSFGATHYMKLPRITEERSQEASTDLKLRGLTRVVHREKRFDYTDPFEPSKTDLFRAWIGGKQLPKYQGRSRSIPLPLLTPAGLPDPRHIVAPNDA